MKRRSYLSLLLLLTMCRAVNSQVANDSASPKENENLANLKPAVKKAFDLRIKTGDPTLVYQLPKTAALVEYIAPYLENKDKDVRLFVINLLKDIKTDESAALLIRALGDAEKNNADEAADNLFVNFDRRILENREDLKNVLLKNAAAGRDEEATILLLGYVPADDSRDILESKCKAAANGRTKINDRAKSLLACVVLFEGGTEKGASLIEKSRSAEYSDYEFLLRNLGYIAEPETLRILFQIAAYDSDNYEQYLDQVPPANILAREPRYLDLAINRFAERLKVNVGFKLTEDKRYSQQQVTLARRAISAEIMRLKNKN